MKFNVYGSMVVQYEAVVEADSYDNAIEIADDFDVEQWTLSATQENYVVVDSAEEFDVSGN